MKHDNDNNPPIRFLSVCSGIEAASVAWHPLGWQAVAFAEIEKFPSMVLAHHYPDVPNLGDFTTIDTKTLGRVDILCGGTPCQAFSVAGARGGLNDARGNLTLAFVELAHALADGNGLRNAVWENVPGVFSDKTNAFGCFLAGLVGADDALRSPDGNKWPDAGMVAGPLGRAAWRILDAQFFGLAQRRRRVVVVADFGNGADPAAVLFERKGMFGNPATRRETGEGTSHPIAPSLVRSGRGVERTGDTRGQDPVVAVFAPEIARCVATREGNSQDYESTTMVAVEVAPTMRAGGNQTGGRRPPGTDVDTADSLVVHAMPAIAFDARQTDVCVHGDVTQSLDTKQPGPAIAQTVAIRGRENGGTAELGGEVATALRASQGGGDKPHVLESGALTTSAVRRLTPLECERLQGFPEVRKTLYIQAWKQRSFDPHLNDANAEIQNRKSPKYALNAAEGGSMFNVQSAAPPSSASHPECVKLADVHALINFERNDLLLRSQRNSNWSVSIAEHLNSSHLSMPIGDFVRLIAHTFTIQERIVQAGKAASPANTTPSSRRLSGNPHNVQFGRESDARASDVELFMKELDAFMKSTTSKAGHEIATLEQRLQTSLSFATSVISSCIPATMLPENSFSLTIEGVRGYTNIPWRNSHISPDGPRYKALGNSWAVPKFRWVGERITRLLAVNDNTAHREAA